MTSLRRRASADRESSRNCICKRHMNVINEANETLNKKQNCCNIMYVDVIKHGKCNELIFMFNVLLVERS